MLAPAAHDALLQEPNGSFAKLCELACKLNVWWRTIELLLNLILTLTLTLTLALTLTLTLTLTLPLTRWSARRPPWRRTQRHC